MAKQLRFVGKTKKGNMKITEYIPTKGASKKKVSIKKKNGKMMIVETTIRTKSR